ncbi:MAG: HD domain-containing protein, partial [Planctomycetes bacterium]|nr:HD domain-containing protein [Planctomycetota bacterium]
MEPVSDLITEIVSTLDRYDAGRCLENICANLLSLSGAGECFIFLSDPLEGVRDLSGARREGGPPVTLPLPAARALAEEVIAGGAWRTWADWKVATGQAGEAAEAVAGVPLRVFENVLGALLVVRAGRPFTDEEQSTLGPVANIVALAVPREELDGFAKLAEICIRFLEEKDSYTHGHSLRVMRYCLLLADEIRLSFVEKRELRVCALLHDIGKVIVKDSILSKKETLTRQELQAIRMHPRIGSSITSRIHPGISNQILAHHEHFDGSGYPAGLKGEEIPMIARIIAV